MTLGSKAMVDEKSKKEIDIFIPELNVGFEYNGIYFHNDKFLKPTYHNDKFNECKELGIQIYNVWENEWLLKKHICKSVILDKIGKNNNQIINSENCEIKEIGIEDVKNFLNDNSMNDIDETINFALGLILDNVIVAIVSFQNLNSDYKMIDLIQNINHNVLNYREKLLNYFVNNYKFDKLVKILNLSNENNEFYIKFGFEKSINFFIDYKWYLNGKLYPRFKKIENKIIEDNLYINGGYKLYDCGNEIYTFKKITPSE